MAAPRKTKQTKQTRTSRAGGASVHVAVLRGINVGGKNILPMKDLVGLFTEAGCGNVRTYIQSGNVVFTAVPGAAQAMARRVEDGIAKRFKFKAPVVVRTAKELARIAAKNPFLAAGADPDSLHVVFLAEEPERKRGLALDPERSPGDRFELRGREIYLCAPNGVGKSKLTNAYFDSTLATISTGRNWRTVLKLLEMAEATG